MARHSESSHCAVARHTGVLVLLLCAILATTTGCKTRPSAGPLQGPIVPLAPNDRLLVLAPHPDDEVLCCGGLIQDAVAMGVPVHVVFFTYGDNNEWSFLLYRKYPVIGREAVQQMGLVRHDEAVAAAHILGVAPEHLTFLGYPDFGTMAIWKTHWGDRPAFKSMLTRVTAVPYANARRPGALYKGEEVVWDLTEVLRSVRPTKVFVSHPSDHNPDHAALYLFTRVALWDLASELQPEVYPYLVHLKRWPIPHGFHPSAFLEPPPPFKDSIAWKSYPLPFAAIARKQHAIKAHRTQYTYSAGYLLSFVRTNELFGDFPVVSLGAGSPPVTLSPQRHDTVEAPEELTEVERSAFVGMETRSVQREGEDIVLSIEFSRPLGQAVEASVYVFGYRADRPFAQMPKLHIKVEAVGYVVYDQDRVLPDEVVRVTRTAKHLTIRIPLALVGQPQYLLTSGQTYLGELPLDWASWRIVEVAPHSGSPSSSP